MEKKRIFMYGKPAYYIYLNPTAKWYIPDVIAEFGFKPISIEQNSNTCGITVCYSANGIVLHALIEPEERPHLVVFDHAPRNIESYTDSQFGAATYRYKGDYIGIMDYVPEPLKIPYASFAKLNIKKIIVNDPAVIVIFEDGDKVVLKRRKGDQFDLDDAISIALCQKMFGKAGYRKRLKKAKKNIYIQYLGDLDHAD